ncbi:hypothetical protein BH09ACT12_BH09ACT12_19550 [soil metagenome]
MSRVSTKMVALGILLVALVLAGIVSFYAASSPDGLTKVSQEKGFAETETDHATGESPFAGYGSSFVDDDRASVGVAGVVGVLVVLGLGSGVTYLVRRRTPESADVS